jgi:hypothetical protein
VDDVALLTKLGARSDTEQVTTRFTVETWPTGHKLPTRLSAYAEHLGATVDYRVGGGWWHKVHHFTVQGTVAQARAVTTFKMRMADDA